VPPPARSDDKGIGVKVLLAIWTVQSERERLKIPLRRPRSVDRTRSLVAVSQKREYFRYSLETIGYFALRMPKIGAWRLVANSQRPAIGGPFCEYNGHFLRASDCMAGDAVLIAPVSTRFPCYQGILQGKSRFQASKRQS
jgi:hypothetical protein